MKQHPRLLAAVLVLCGAMPLAVAAPAVAQTTLRVYLSPTNRLELMRKLLDQYERKHPGIKVVVESGGATSDLQRRYLSTVLSARDASLDVMQIDIVNPAQFIKAGWIEPLDSAAAGDAQALLKGYLPAHAQANLVGGRVATLPAYVDAQFLYYRKDLLAKYGITPPRTWDELAVAARRVLDAEKRPQLKGLSIQGAPIDGTVCTFLTPYWSQGKELIDANGRLSLDKPAAEKGMAMWLGLMEKGVISKNTAEVKTQDTTNDFRGGQVVFAVSWGMSWGRYQEADSPVKDQVDIVPLPAMSGGQPATCAGGWVWATSAFSKNKQASADLVRWLASAEVAKVLAVQGALMPAHLALYQDADVLKAQPWMAAALPVLESARGRPVSARYGEISDTVRTTTSAMLGRSQNVEMGVANIESRLRRVLR